MRSGDKPRNSARYRRLVTRVRGMLRSRINAALNRLVTVRKPAVLRLERLDFRSPHLSRRMNRPVTNCGRAVFKAKLVDLEERFGILADQMPSPYTSQECSKCGYIDRANRRSQS
ncbi:MAG: transposase, partial [Alphaproteobacteria bacterium]|nr:transposase [Alphaproteobacteria bacterium]